MSDKELLDAMRDAAAGGIKGNGMIGTVILIAEFIDEDGDPALFTWDDGGTAWQRDGMARWYQDRLRERGIDHHLEGEEQ